MNAALMGSVSSSAAALRGLLRGGLEITGVLGLPEDMAARISDYANLGSLAKQAGVPFVPFRKVTEDAVRSFLADRRPDWLFVIGLSQLVSADLRGLATQGAVGFHPTPLPEGRGRAPVAWTILLDRPAAANLFFLTDEADAGDVIAQRPVPVLPNDYAADLIARTNVVLEEMAAELAPAFACGEVPRTPQDHSRATWYARRRPEDGLIDWTQSARDIQRLIRAVSRPYPGAFTGHHGQKIVIWRADWTGECSGNAAPGTVVEVRGGKPVIQAGRGLVQVLEYETAGPAAPVVATGDRLG